MCGKTDGHACTSDVDGSKGEGGKEGVAQHRVSVSRRGGKAWQQHGGGAAGGQQQQQQSGGGGGISRAATAAGAMGEGQAHC